MNIPVYKERNYDLFNVLCGVRSESDDEPMISEPRGLPDDVSVLVKQASEHDPYCHSHSWVTLDEILAFHLENMDDKGFSPLKQLLDACCNRVNGDGFENFRVVFWFDS